MVIVADILAPVRSEVLATANVTAQPLDEVVTVRATF
jgi:hypothetical protein